MKKKIISLTTICFSTVSILSAQVSLQKSLNGYRPGDKIIKQQMDYIAPGAAGTDIQWDFSQLNVVEENYPLIYFRPVKGDTIQVAGWEHETQYSYKRDTDTLWLTGYRNQSVAMKFDVPELQLRFPLNYGDTLSAAFQGVGLAYHEMDMVAEGRTSIIADAIGTLITPGADVLQNVLRVKRTRMYNNVGVEGASVRMETYNWYAPGYRYPVFETVLSTEILNGEEQTHFGTAFYFPIAALESLKLDPENEAIREQAQQDQGILISCQIAPNPVETHFSVVFELSATANVSIRLCNIVGVPVSNGQMETLPAGQHERSFSMQGLLKGNYVLYVQANNYVNKQIIIKK